MDQAPKTVNPHIYLTRVAGRGITPDEEDQIMRARAVIGKISEGDDATFMARHETYVASVKALRERIPEPQETLLLHALNGSTPTHECLYFDHKGEIALTVEALLTEWANA